VVRQRTLARDESAREVADAQEALERRCREHERAREAVLGLQTELDGARAGTAARAREGARAREIQGSVARDGALEDRLAAAVALRDAAQSARQDAARDLEGARARLGRAQADLESVERHRRRWLEERRREAERKAEEDP
jgi:hypothetical protein